MPHTSTRLKVESIIREESPVTTFSLTFLFYGKKSPSFESCSDLYPELLRSGCGTLTRANFLLEESKFGSRINVQSSYYSVTYSCSFREKDTSSVMKLLLQMIQKPLLSEKELKRVKVYIRESIKSDTDNAGYVSRNLWYRTLTHKDDPLHPQEDSIRMSELETVNAKAVRTFHETILKGMCTLTCGGTQKSCEQIISSVRTLVKNTDSNSSRNEIAAVSRVMPKGRTFVHCAIPHQQNIVLSIGGIVPISWNDELFPAWSLLLSILGLPGGFTGRLMSTVREKEGLTYGIYAHTEFNDTQSPVFWRVGTFFSPKDVIQGITATYRELSLMKKKGVSESELERFKKILRTRYLLGHDSLVKKTMSIHGYRVRGISSTHIEQYYEAITKVTRNDIAKVISLYFNPENILVSAAGPIDAKREKEIKSCVESLGNVHK